MGLIDALARLDARVLPRLARGLRRVDRLTRRFRVSPLTVAAVVLVAAVVTTIVWRTDEPPGGVGTSSFVPVGVTNGNSIPRYVEESRSELERLAVGSPPRPLYALVSFTTYLPPDRVAALVAAVATGNDDLTTITAHARVPVPRRQTTLFFLPANRVPDDLVAAMGEVADRKAVEASEYTQLAQAESVADLRARLEGSAALAQIEATAYRGACSCVFALVVRAPAAVLVALSKQRDVRAVDAAPEVTQLDRAMFHPPFPEQLDTVQPPPDDGVTSPAAVATQPAATS